MAKQRASLWDRLTNNVLSRTETLVFTIILVGIGIAIGVFVF
jgi:hypothetical protein